MLLSHCCSELTFQVTNITETFPLQPGQTADSLVVAVERSVQQFLDQGDAALRSCPLAHGTALETLTDALVDVRDTGWFITVFISNHLFQVSYKKSANLFIFP